MAKGGVIRIDSRRRIVLEHARVWNTCARNCTPQKDVSTRWPMPKATQLQET